MSSKLPLIFWFNAVCSDFKLINIFISNSKFKFQKLSYCIPAYLRVKFWFNGTLKLLGTINSWGGFK